MGRILLLLILGFVIWLLFRSFFRSQVKDARPPAATAKGEDMVVCARCGVNLPKSDAREEGGRLVCRDNPNCRSAA